MKRDDGNAAAKRFGGAWPTMITPFDKDFKIDIKAYRQLVNWYLTKNVSGMYANCLSSEMYNLSADEKIVLIEETLETVNGRVPVAATGNFGTSIDEHIEFCKRVADTNVDIVMLLVPEFCIDDEAMEKYYLTLAEKVDSPLGLYECPVPRSYHLGVPLVRTLAETGRFEAYKETSCDLDKIKKLLCETDHTPLSILQANLPYLHEAVKAGTPGAMNIASIWAPDLVAAVIEKTKQNDPMAVALHQELVTMEMAQRAVHPGGSKYFLQKRGLPVSSSTRARQAGLEVEVEFGLDIIARKWFNNDGNLKILENI